MALFAGGALEVTHRDGTDRYTRTIAMFRVNGIDVGLAMIQSGLARTRYDSRDGYGKHPNESLYHALQRRGRDGSAHGRNLHGQLVGRQRS